MKEFIIDKGIKIPLYLLHYKLTKNEILTFCILNNFNKNRSKTLEELEKLKNSNYNTLKVNKSNLEKIIPLSKNTIKSALEVLDTNHIIEIIDETYFTINLKLFPFNKTKCIKEGFIFIPIEILYNKKLNTLDKIVLSYIKGFKDSNKSFNFTNNNLSKKLNIPNRTIKLVLKKLNDLDLIERNKEGNSRTMNINQTNIDNYFEDSDIREIKEARIEKAKIDQVNKINKINKVESLTAHTVNIINLNSLENIELTEEQKQLIREKLKL